MSLNINTTLGLKRMKFAERLNPPNRKDKTMTDNELLHKWFGGMASSFEARIGRETLLELAQTCERRRGDEIKEKSISTEFEDKAKTICFDLVGRIQELDKVAQDIGKTALIEPGSINNHVAALAVAHRDEQVKLLEGLKERFHNMPRHRPTNTNLWDGVQVGQVIIEIDAEIVRLKQEGNSI